MSDIWRVNSMLDDRPSDVVLCVGSCIFHLHKDILIKNCDYFKAMFSSQMLENALDIITIQLIEKEPFEILVHGFYSGHLMLTSENVFEVTLTAHILQVARPLFCQCCDFLKALIDPRKCFEIMQFTRFHNLQEIYDLSRRYCLTNFLTLCKEESFYNLSIDDIVDYLTDEFLVADADYEVIQALAGWCDFNDFSDFKILQEIITKIFHRTDVSSPLFTKIAQKLATREKLDRHILSRLHHRRLNQDLMMFWARLSDSNGEGLVDVVKLDDIMDRNDVKGVRVDTMTELVEKPGFDLGSAVCVKGPYVYVCGGGPNFGRMDWIRDLWRYSVLEDKNRWKAIGKLPLAWRYHTMVAVDTKLYIFGGFGKFRSKNCNLDSFDIIDGTWSQHACIPKHEIKPVATCHHTIIFYVCREWKVYAYDTLLNQWTTLSAIAPLQNISTDQNGPSHPCGSNLSKPLPLACFVSPDSSHSSALSLLVISKGSDFQIHSLKLNMDSNSFFSSTSQLKHEVDMKSFAYFESCVLEGKVVILFKKKGEDLDEDDWDENDNEETKECKPVHLMHFMPDTGELRDWIQMNNVEKSLTSLAVPRLPKTFNLASNSNSSKPSNDSVN